MIEIFGAALGKGFMGMYRGGEASWMPAIDSKRPASTRELRRKLGGLLSVSESHKWLVTVKNPESAPVGWLAIRILVNCSGVRFGFFLSISSLG